MNLCMPNPVAPNPVAPNPAVTSAEPLIKPMQQSMAIMATAGGRKRKHTTQSNAIKKCKKTRKNKNKKTRANKTRANKTRVKYTCKK